MGKLTTTSDLSEDAVKFLTAIYDAVSKRLAEFVEQDAVKTPDGFHDSQRAGFITALQTEGAIYAWLDHNDTKLKVRMTNHGKRLVEAAAQKP
jgi:hypothetical protein